MQNFNGLGMNLGNLSRFSDAESRTITAENPTGEKGRACSSMEGVGAKAAREMGLGWKISPALRFQPGEKVVLADIEGPGALQHLWMTCTGKWRLAILRIYWDGQEEPSVECPIGHFFCCGWDTFAPINSMPVCVNPGKGFNCYWEMPFRKRCKVTLENISVNPFMLYYQIDYTLTEIPEDRGYFHAQYRYTPAVPVGEMFTILDGVKGRGQYVGTYMAMTPRMAGWWGEGEVKFYIDGDKEFPTICSTGSEDYFCGSYDFMYQNRFTEYSNAYCGMPQVIQPDGKYQFETRFSLYRFHVMDPVRFKSDLRIEMQDLGWDSRGDQYRQRSDMISTVAFWYQTLPSPVFPKLPSVLDLEIPVEPYPQG